jgi:hypothetical protein
MSAILCHSLPFSAILCQCLPMSAILCQCLPSYRVDLCRFGSVTHLSLLNFVASFQGQRRTKVYIVDVQSCTVVAS